MGHVHNDNDDDVCHCDAGVPIEVLSDSMEPQLTERERAMLVRLGTLSGLMVVVAEILIDTPMFDELIDELQNEVKKTDELVQIWSSL